MHRNRHLFNIRVFPIRKTNTFENADLYRTNWRKLMYFHAIVQIYVHLDNRRTSQPQIIDGFVWNYGKLSPKFLIWVIDTVGFLSFFFFNFTRTQLLKFREKFPSYFNLISLMTFYVSSRSYQNSNAFTCPNFLNKSKLYFEEKETRMDV